MKGVIHCIAPPPPVHSRQIPSTSQNNIIAQQAKRRATVGVLLLATVVSPFTFASSASAFSLGISGPKEWLKEQKKKTSKFVLAPIEASRIGLNEAYKLLMSENGVPVDSEDFNVLINSAARDCVPNQRNSIVSFQSRTGVEVCTYSLILKNASSLLDNKDPVKLETEASLDTLVRSFSNIGDAVTTSNFELASDRKKMGDGLMETISALEIFEEGIKRCLGISN